MKSELYGLYIGTSNTAFFPPASANILMRMESLGQIPFSHAFLSILYIISLNRNLDPHIFILCTLTIRKSFFVDYNII